MRANRSVLLSMFLLIAAAGFAQQSTNPNQNAPGDPQTMVVTGSFEPVPLAEANRSVVSLDVAQQPLLYNSVIDVLHSDPSIDMEERAPGGIQTDLSIWGATFEQSLVLLNGLRMNDAQSGHHDMDLPVPLEAIARVEVLHGAGSTLYGADALGGAVNFITAKPISTELRARVGMGNFGISQEHLLASFLGTSWSERVAADRDSSSGFLADRDYQSGSAASESYAKTGLGNTDILFAGSDRQFGASQFYGDYPSWERTKAWVASVWQDLGDDTAAAFGYRRHSDEFVLVRDDPGLYENNHISQSWQANLRRKSAIKDDGKLSYGLEAYGDEIESNNLGHHARNREAGYVNLDLQSLRRIFLTAGAREEVFSGGRTEFLPAVAAGLWLRNGFRLRGSASRAFRLPTYTDLYYSDPADIGNPFLKPESAWEFEGGLEWSPGGRMSAQVTAFDRREQDDIDYVRISPSTPWQATNIPHIDFVGLEIAAKLRMPRLHEIELAYTELTANQQLQPGLTSKYVFNYPSQNAVFVWMGQFGNIVNARTRVGATQRFGQGAYAVWDLAFSASRGMVRPYLQFSNLNNATYEEIPGVMMPTRSVTGGIELILKRHADPT